MSLQIKCFCNVSWTCATPLFIHNNAEETPPPLLHFFFFFLIVNGIRSGMQQEYSLHPWSPCMANLLATDAAMLIPAVRLRKQGWAKTPECFHPEVGGDAGLTKLVLNSESVTCGSIVFIIYVYIIGDAEHVSKATIGQKWYRCTQMIFIHVCCVPRSQTPQTSPGSLLQNCRY